MVDVSRATTGVSGALPAAVSAEILQSLQVSSVVAQLATNVPLPGSGVAVPIVTSDPVAAWVGETAAKPVSNGSVTTKILRPYKIAVIETFSNEFVRDLPALYGALIGRLPGALAAKFDATVFGTTGAPGSDFDQLGAATAVALGGKTYAGLVDVISAVGVAGGSVNGWVVSPQGFATLLGATDSSNRSLLVSDLNNGGLVSILGAPVIRAAGANGVQAGGTPNRIGFAGDWTSARYGTVEGVKIDISTQATVGGINLFEQNMIAVRAEIEVGFRVQDVAKFVKLTDGTHA